MNFLNKNLGASFKAIKHWYDGDQTNPRDRYVYIDGSPYGTKSITRFITNPAVLTGAFIGLFEMATRGFLSPPDQRLNELETDAITIGTTFPISYFFDLSNLKKNLPALKDVIIDKTGRIVSDPNALARIRNHYNTEIAQFFILVPPVAAGLAVAFHQIPLPFLAYRVARAGYSLYAKRKLNKGQWSIQIKPPELKEEAPVRLSNMVPASAKLFAANRIA